MTTATLLLPASGRFEGAALPPVLARALARADLQLPGGDGRRQLQRHFPEALAAGSDWPVAALTRQLDAADAADGLWLRADPAHVAADMQGVRMLAHGPALALDADQAQQLAQDLVPVFAGHGMQLSTPSPERWYLRLPAGLALPDFVDIDQVLGDDLFDHLPEGEPGRVWRSLLSDTQVLLHQHPVNGQRAAQGKAAVNSLWFWGLGRLPAGVACRFGQVRSPDPLLQAIAAQTAAGDAAAQLVDLRHLRSAQVVMEQALLPLLAALDKGELDGLELDFADGLVYRLRRGQRWRLWRRAQAGVVR